jgi:hypothetical protein
MRNREDRRSRRIIRGRQSYTCNGFHSDVCVVPRQFAIERLNGSNPGARHSAPPHLVSARRSHTSFPSSPQRHPKSLRFLTRRALRPLQFARNHRCLCLLPRKGLQRANIILRPRQPLRLLRHSLLHAICSRISRHRTVKVVIRPEQTLPSVIHSVRSECGALDASPQISGW